MGLPPPGCHVPSDGKLVLFRFWTVTKKAARNTDTHAFVGTMLLFLPGEYLAMEGLVPQGVLPCTAQPAGRSVPVALRPHRHLLWLDSIFSCSAGRVVVSRADPADALDSEWCLGATACWEELACTWRGAVGQSGADLCDEALEGRTGICWPIRGIQRESDLVSSFRNNFPCQSSPAMERIS